ncbi:MAG TPA: anthranilate phosphoribosyltransferase [Thermoleophilaceae bacterium]|nr:anthranilate phosphoribosyltransferase [Thermoleophilaceae bacterium]
MPNPVLSDAINAVCRGDELAEDEAAHVLREVMEGRSTPEETSGLLIALRTRGETADEIAGLARTMRELATKVDVPVDGLLDTAGTGGGTPTFNVSTTAAFVAAGAGCPVAKHGNRSATSQCGSADVLEALGARIDLGPEQVADCIRGVGFGFMFAPQHHAAMKHVVPIRKALGVRTIFNLLGPLTNPAGAPHQVIGVSDGPFLEHMAMALARLGGRSALVVSSEDGLDEISISAPTRVVELRDGKVDTYTVTPEELGVERAPIDAIAFGTPEENAHVTREVLSGLDRGPARGLTLANAGAAIYAAERADSLAAGVAAAAEAVDSGAANDVMERFVARTQELGTA